MPKEDKDMDYVSSKQHQNNEEEDSKPLQRRTSPQFFLTFSSNTALTTFCTPKWKAVSEVLSSGKTKPRRQRTQSLPLSLVRLKPRKSALRERRRKTVMRPAQPILLMMSRRTQLLFTSSPTLHCLRGWSQVGLQRQQGLASATWDILPRSATTWCQQWATTRRGLQCPRAHSCCS